MPVDKINTEGLMQGDQITFLDVCLGFMIGCLS